MADSEKVISEETDEQHQTDADSLSPIDEITMRMFLFMAEYVKQLNLEESIKRGVLTWDAIRSVMEDLESDVPEGLRDSYWELCKALYPQEEEAEDRDPHARKGEYVRRSDTNTPIVDLKVPIDPISKAIFGRNRGHVTAQDYWSEKPKVIGTGKNGRSVALTIQPSPSSGLDICAKEQDYVLSDRTSFWLDAVVSLAKAGNDVILGSDLLRQNNYENPYSESMATTMGEALNQIMLAKQTLVGVDASNEVGKFKPGKRPTISIELKSVLDAGIYLDEYQDGSGRVRDFRIVLNSNGDNLLEALPLAKQAENRDELVTISPEEERFATVKRLTETERRMWRYVLKTIKSRSARSTIVFDTMFRNIEPPEPEVAQTQALRVKNPETGKFETVLGDDGKPVQVQRTPKQLEAAKKKASAAQRRRLISRLEKMMHEKTHPKLVPVLDSEGKPRTNPRTGEKMTEPEFSPIVTGYKFTAKDLSFTRKKN